VVQRAFVMTEDKQITDEWLPTNEPAALKVTAGGRGEPVLAIRLGTSMAEMERQLILATLSHRKNHKEQTAAVLGVSLKTLNNRLKEYAGALPAEDSAT
jgi:DNA-binding NtrC family response regulator